MTPKFVRAYQNWSGHITPGTGGALISFFLKMADSSEEGDAKSGDLVEEAYENLVKKVYPVGASVAREQCIRRKAQKFVVKGGEMYFKKKKKGKVVHFNLANAHNCVVRTSWVELNYYR